MGDFPDYRGGGIEASPSPFTKAKNAIQAKQDALAAVFPIGQLLESSWNLRLFENAAIVYNEDLEKAFEVHGAIHAKWKEYYSSRSYFFAISDETPTSDGIGRFNNFGEAGLIYWSPETGAHLIRGAIYAKWLELGAERFAFPTSDEIPSTYDGKSRYSQFGNAGTICWSPDAGAYLVSGAIHNKYSELGFGTSYLGVATSDEVDFLEGGREQSFQGGGIVWWPGVGAIAVSVISITYKGLICYGETDNDQGSASDEPYLVMTAGGISDVALFPIRTRIYDGVDAGESRPDNIRLGNFKPFGAAVVVQLLEHDYGDPDELTRRDFTAIENLTQRMLNEHYKKYPSGPMTTRTTVPLRNFVKGVSKAFDEIFGRRDDRVANAEIVFPADEMIRLAVLAPEAPVSGIMCNYISPLLSCDGATYRACFSLSLV